MQRKKERRYLVGIINSTAHGKVRVYKLLNGPYVALREDTEKFVMSGDSLREIEEELRYGIVW